MSTIIGRQLVIHSPDCGSLASSTSHERNRLVDILPALKHRAFSSHFRNCLDTIEAFVGEFGHIHLIVVPYEPHAPELILLDGLVLVEPL